MQNKAQLLLGIFSNLQTIRTAGTNLVVAVMLARDSSTITPTYVNYNMNSYNHKLTCSTSTKHFFEAKSLFSKTRSTNNTKNVQHVPADFEIAFGTRTCRF